MDDIIIQLARLWGYYEGQRDTPEERRFSDELKQWDSEEMANKLQIWSNEIRMFSSYGIDTCEFFEEKRKSFLKTNIL